MNWVQQLTRSGPHAWRPPKESKSRSVVWSASGSGHSFPARSENSCWTTRGCAMRCAGPCSIAEGLARNIGVAQQPWACSHLTTNRGVGAPSGRGSGFIHNLLTYHIENKTYEKTMLGQTNFEETLPEGVRGQAILAVKDEYTFDFLDLEAAPIGKQIFAHGISERDPTAFWLVLDTYATRLLAQALKGFSTAGELWVYDRKRGTYDKRRPETTAIRKGFYAVKDEHGKKDYGEVERRLSVIESHADLLPENWSSYYESPMAQDGQKEDSLWANDTHRSRSCASCARRRQS